jgi:GNAT superfamily N-acetyltransferase
VRADAERLPGPYRPPRGRLYLAWLEGRPVGCVALRPVGPAVAEVKRLFVLPAARGQGAGRALMTALLDDARRLGYERVRLGTLDEMTAAQRLYAFLGFVEIPNYQGAASVDTRFFELRLGTTAPP